MKQVFFFTILLVLLITGCRNPNSGKPKEIIVFHAGSLSVPMKLIAQEYEKQHPGINILLESAGSLVSRICLFRSNL